MQRAKPPPPRTSSSSSQDVQRYQDQVRAELKQALETVKTLEDTASQISQVADTVRSLPSKLREQVLVPFGKQAFFLGETCHTNEITVHLGSRYYAECTAAHAAGVLDRRQQLLQRNAEQVGKQVHKLEARLKLAGQELVPGGAGGSGKDGEGLVHEDGEEVVEIRETLEESEALLGRVVGGTAAAASGTHSGGSGGSGGGGGGGFDELFARVEELERMEAEAERAASTRQQRMGAGAATNAPPAQGNGPRPPPSHLPPSSDGDLALAEDFFTPIPLDDLRPVQEATENLAQPSPASTSAAKTTPPTPAASLSPQPSRSGALKKGFFDTPSKPRAPAAKTKTSTEGSPGGAAAAAAPLASGPTSAGGAVPAAAATAPQPRPQQRRAFTGVIVERGGDAAPASGTTPDQTLPQASPVGGPSPAPTAKAPSPAAAAAQRADAVADSEPVEDPPKRVSKFKQQMLQQRGGA